MRVHHSQVSEGHTQKMRQATDGRVFDPAICCLPRALGKLFSLEGASYSHSSTLFRTL